VEAQSDGLFSGRIPTAFVGKWRDQCQRAHQKVDDARCYCLEGEALRYFYTILAGDILLGGNGGGTRLDPRRSMGEFYPPDWL